MMDKLKTSFMEMLHSELAQLTRLEAVLNLEHVALEKRDNDALVKNTKEKQVLLTSIEQLGRDRLALLETAGEPTDKEGVLTFVRAAPTLLGQWEELEAALLHCQKQNQINGMLLEKGKQQTQQLLGILLGEGNRKDTQLYDARGTTSPSFMNGHSIKV